MFILHYLFKSKDLRPKYSPQSDAVSIAVSASIIGLVAFIILFLICWVCPRCYLYKRFRSPRRKSMFVRQNGRMFLERHFSVVSTFDSSLSCDYDSYGRHDTIPSPAFSRHSGQSVPSLPGSAKYPTLWRPTDSSWITTLISGGW